jgi:hypothetical protein
MKRTIAALGVVLALALSGSAVAATPAYAHYQWGCPHGVACLFEHINGGGDDLLLIWSAWERNVCHAVPANWRTKASSASADYGNDWDLVLYERPNCQPLYGRINSPGTMNFTNTRAYLNDDVESFAILR